MTPTTSGAILAHFAARIQALVPETAPAGRGFVFNVKAYDKIYRPLRPWVPEMGGDVMFRRFEIRRGRRADLGVNDPEVQLVSLPFTVRLAYAADPTFVSLEQRHELETLIETDATQIRDELESPSALESDAHQANLDLVVEELDANDENHWFQQITLRAVFWTAKRS